jgi:hypothetical protein
MLLMPLLAGNEGRGTTDAFKGSKCRLRVLGWPFDVEGALAYFALVTRLGARGLEPTRWVAANNYPVELPTSARIAERVLWPNGPTEPVSRITASDR